MFINLSSLDSINYQLKVLSDAINSDLEIDANERMRITDKLSSFTRDLANEIRSFENRYSVELFRNISIVFGITAVIIFIISASINSTKQTYREILVYSQACSEGKLAKCSEGIAYWNEDDTTANNLISAYYNATGKTLVRLAPNN
jgi:hypothetical protein